MLSHKLGRSVWIAVLMLIIACHGGGSSHSSTDAPTDLSYPISSAVYNKGLAISPLSPSNKGGAVSSYSVSPALPAGLKLSVATGTISGKPTVIASKQDYTISAFNSGGSTHTVLSLEVELAPASLIKKVIGDIQTAVPGTAVSVNPEVVVVNQFAEPIGNIDVTFTIMSGSGHIENSHVLTDSTGHASCGTWVLGSGKGIYALKADVDGLAPVMFTAFAASVSPEISLQAVSPNSGSTASEMISVIITSTSTFELSSVTASLNGTSVPLHFGSLRPVGLAWSGYLPIAGQPRGRVGLVITATDVFSHTTDLVIPVVLYGYNFLTLSAPLDSSVARPTIELAAATVDVEKTGPFAMTAKVNNTVVATGVNSLSQSPNLSAFEGQKIDLAVSAVDALGRATTTHRTVFVESSPRLSMKAQVAGHIWDISGTRILYLDTTTDVAVLKIFDSSNNGTEIVETHPDLTSATGFNAFLTPGGAIYGHAVTFDGNHVYEWRNGILSHLDKVYAYTGPFPNEPEYLRVSGSWAKYSRFDTNELLLRNLDTNASTIVATNAGFVGDVLANGEVVYDAYDSSTGTSNIYRWREGVAQAVTQDIYPLQNNSPVSDGANVVYEKGVDIFSYIIAMNDGNKETLLAESEFPLDPRIDYLTAGGYVAYRKLDVTKTSQIWRHYQGSDVQLSFFGLPSKIDAINSGGTVFLSSGQKRYQATLGGSLTEVGSTLGKVVFRDGHTLVIVGGVVFELNP